MDRSAVPAEILQDFTNEILNKWINGVPHIKKFLGTTLLLDVVQFKEGDTVPSSLEHFLYWVSKKFTKGPGLSFYFPIRDDMQIVFGTVEDPKEYWGESGGKLYINLVSRHGHIEDHIYLTPVDIRKSNYLDLEGYLDMEIINAVFKKYRIRFDSIRKYFDGEQVIKVPINVINDGILLENAREEMGNIIELFSDNLSYSDYYTDKFPRMIYNSKEKIEGHFKLSGELSYQEFGKIIGSHEKNMIRVKQYLKSTYDLKTYAVHPSEVEIGYKAMVGVSEKTIYVEFILELITNEDYWGTIGYYETRIANVCKENSVYNESEIYQIAEELGVKIKGSNKKMCSTLNEYVLNTSINDYDLK